MEDDSNDSNCPKTVAMLAVQVVSQVIHEAQTVVQAINGSGEPLIYACLSKKIRNGERFGKDISEFTSSAFKKNDTDDVDKEIVIATSTPQKKLHRVSKVNNDDKLHESIVTGIGGGDERFIPVNLVKSTSSFVNEVSDLTEVEKVSTGLYCNESRDYGGSSISEQHNVESTSEILENFLNRDLNVAMRENANDSIKSEFVDKIETISSQNSNYSTYSLLSDIGNLEDIKDVLSINNEIQNADDSNRFCATSNEAAVSDHDEQNGFTLFEKTFSTLNRDEHNSEDGGQILDDVTSASLQDVELLPVHVPHEAVKCHKEEKEEESRAGSRSKRPMMKQWRKNGVRLLAFLRNFWRRKTLKTKISTSVPSKLAFFALSPEGGRLASSLLDDSSSAPSPARRCARKFNTVNEATLFPQRWRKYTSKYNLDEVAGVFENNQ